MRGLSIIMQTVNWIWIWFLAKEICSGKRMDIFHFLLIPPSFLYSDAYKSFSHYFVCLFRERWDLYIKKKQDFVFAVMRNIRWYVSWNEKHTSCSYKILQLFYWQINISFFLFIFLSVFCVSLELIFFPFFFQCVSCTVNCKAKLKATML